LLSQFPDEVLLRVLRDGDIARRGRRPLDAVDRPRASAARACRYTDPRNGLPGIASNLLAERLRELEQAGVIARDEAPPPIATTFFRLTPRGEQSRRCSTT
jgi:hypothetical protein